MAQMRLTWRLAFLLASLFVWAPAISLAQALKDTGTICDAKADTRNSYPCIDQPAEGATQVTGRADLAAKVKITACGTSPTDADTSTKAGQKYETFSASVHSLSQDCKVKAEEFDENDHSTGRSTEAKVQPTGGINSRYTLAIAGIDITSTASSGPQQQYFADISLLNCIGGCKEVTPPNSWLWFTARIASVPSPKTADLSSLTSFNTSVPGLSQQKIGDITQTLEFHGGYEWSPLWRDGNTASLSLIAEVGGTTPFNSLSGAQEYDLTDQNSTPASGTNPDSQALAQFTNNQDLKNAFPILYAALAKQCVDPKSTSTSSGMIPCPPKAVAFVLPNRSRFYREYAGGFRARFFASDNKDAFPTSFDLKFGQDETVTGGHLHKFVITIAGDGALPGASWLHVFGAAYLGLTRNKNTTALILPPLQTFVVPTDPTVVIQPISPQDQDYFRLGIGIDIIQAFKSLKGNSSTTTGGSTAPKKSGP